MEIGCFLSTIEAGVSECGLTFKAALDKAREAGITAIDADQGYLERYSPKEFSSLLAEADITIASVHGLIRCPFETAGQYQASLEAMKRYMDMALEAGSSRFMPVPQVPVDYRPETHDLFVERVREMFCQWVDYGVRQGLIVTVENFSDGLYPYTSFEDIDYLLSHIPDLSYTYDSGNYVLAGFSEVEGARRFAADTVYVHLKDLKEVESSNIERRGIYYDSLELGGGVLRNEEALKILRAQGYDGPVIIEVNTGPNFFDRSLRSAAYLKTVLSRMA